MSDTPRTDAFVAMLGTVDPETGMYADWSEMRNMERELAAVTAERDAEIARLRKEFDSVMELLQAERRYTESLNERLVKSDLAEIQRLRALLAETQELHRIEKRDAALAREACAESVAERDAALAKIKAHNAAMDYVCQAARQFNACEEDHRGTVKCATCPRRYYIEVD